MFNGLIREFGKVESFSGNKLKIRAKFEPNLGDSIAVNGACLSVVEKFSGGFSVELSSESAKALAVENFKNLVHIEPAMRLGDRIDGHLMQGHIDFIGEISAIKRLESGTDFYINLPKNAMKFMANKGSVGVDGVSLTISEVIDNSIRLTIIPLTLKDTLFGSYTLKRRVNIESDLLARYADRVLNFKDKKGDEWQKMTLFSSLY
ncbi:MAG: riboflavin synthase [Campylobacter sp.]|nr:riboflavin synthase [Campylobacter sp.]